MSPRGWTPEFMRWIALPQAQENMTSRAVVTPQDPCVFLAEANEFDSHHWFGKINMMLHVDADSTVVPCCMHPQAGVFGNIMTQRYGEILDGGARREFKQKMQDNRAAMPVCGVCDVAPTGNEGPSYWTDHLPERQQKLVT